MLKSKKCAKFCENQTKRCKVSMAWGRNEVVDGRKKTKEEGQRKQSFAERCTEKEYDADVFLFVLKMELGTS